MSLLRPCHVALTASVATAIICLVMVGSESTGGNRPFLPFAAPPGRANPVVRAPDAAMQGRLFFGSGAGTPFLTDTAAAAAQPPSTEAAPPAPALPILVGTALGRNVSSVAVVRLPNGESRAVRSGEIVDGWTVGRIGARRIEIRKGSERQSIEIGQASAQ